MDTKQSEIFSVQIFFLVFLNEIWSLKVASAP